MRLPWVRRGRLESVVENFNLRVDQVLELEQHTPRKRDEALARVADLERALGQFSAGEAVTDLCDCEVSRWNLHLAGHCWQALVEANDEGKLTDEPWHVLTSAKAAAVRSELDSARYRNVQAARDNLPDEAKVTYGVGGSRQTDGHTDLCDCPVSVVNEHLTGYCGTARLEASKAGTLMSTDCTCPPGWKHRAADCPFNPNPEQKQGQRHG